MVALRLHEKILGKNDFRLEKKILDSKKKSRPLLSIMACYTYSILRNETKWNQTKRNQARYNETKGTMQVYF